MSLTEILTEVEKLTAGERKELLAALREAEKQDNSRATETTGGETPKSFAEAAAHLIGSIKSGLPSDLSTNKKHMEGFGRD